jgi:hypothetical protein
MAKLNQHATASGRIGERVGGIIMKYFIALLPAALVLVFASGVQSQSLADLANKEKDRRAEVKSESKVITNQDTTKYGGGAVTTIEESEKKPAEKTEPPQAGKKDSDEPADFQGRPESYWRTTMSEARQKVKDLENEANALTLKVASLRNQFYSEDNGFKRETIQRDLQKAFYEQDLNKENLAKAKDMLQDLEKEARKSGALPGWIQ